ncbi:pre-peptidase C-terminal domain-containing protein [Treponema sp. R80B11-R83G3]
MAVNGEDTFTIVPQIGLAVNTYAVIVTVSGSNGITATFNVSFTVNGAGTTVINIAAIQGVTAPVPGGIPVTAITGNEQYSGTVTWSPALASNSRTVKIDMYDSYGDGWNGSGALRIVKNGVQLATGIKVSSGSSNTYTFTVAAGDAVQVYWVAGFSQSENSFIMYYADTPPSPAFTSSNNNSWSGSNALVYKLRGTMTNIAGGTLLGSFTNVEPYAAGTQYTATITLTAKTGYTLQGVAANFFTVAGATTVGNDANSGVVTAVFPTAYAIYGITLSQAAPHTFTAATIGYSAQPLTVTITNTGNQATGALTVALGGTGADSFTLSKESITNIAVSGEDAFTVSPITGLAANTYAATVTVSGSNGITAAFNVSFTVNLPSIGAITTLTADTWADGNIPTSSDVQWFKFTATASTQYIHVKFGTLTDLYVQAYNTSGATVGSRTELYSTRYVSWKVTAGQEYYISVQPYGSNSGTYQITFNALPFPLGTTITTLTADTWADRNPTSSDGWFKFTATASTQYIHVKFGTLTGMYVHMYDSSYAEVGSGSNLNNINNGSTKYVSQTVTVGQEYYIGVSSGSGTYQIAFNALPAPPGTTITTLTANTWENGNLPTSSSVQWFKFTATASRQYIHANFSTLSDLYVQAYDSSYAEVGSEARIINYISQTLTTGQEYYIRVRPYSSSGSGTYQIAFNALPVSPSTTITTLTANTWQSGNLPTSSSEQWFKFTATASTQYIHVEFSSLSDLYVLLYDSNNGTAVGSETRLSRPTTSSRESVSKTVTNNQVYYIRVQPYNNASTYNSGTYRIAFNTSLTPPN